MPKKAGGYRDALKFIYDREHFGMKLGIENISRFLDSADNPHHKFKSVHIAGTNGKGSTAAYIDAIARKAGYKVGIFTSPHLADFRERIRLNGKKITKRFITEFINKHRARIEKDKITFFEVCTAMAFCYFAKNRVDLAVVEVGLGGRLDATNTLKPVLSIITDISYDHTNILGDTLSKIAWEKAGIVKRETPVVIGSMVPEPRREIIRVCRERGASYDYVRPSTIAANGHFGRFDYRNDGILMDRLKSSLPGRHQLKNAATAIRAVENLRTAGFEIGRGAIRSGLAETVWPGRFEVLCEKGRPTIVLDVGHNRAGVKAFADCFKERFPGRKARMVIGFVRFKNLIETVRHLFPIAESVEIAWLKTERSIDPEEIAELFPRNRFPVSISNSLTDSARRIINNSDRDDIVFIGGSHYAVGEFMENRTLIL